jgi:hypothetical protein
MNPSEKKEAKTEPENSPHAPHKIGANANIPTAAAARPKGWSQIKFVHLVTTTGL